MKTLARESVAPRRRRPRWAVWLVVLVLLVVAAVVGLTTAYLYERYVDVVRFSAERGQVTVRAAHIDGLGRVLVTNKGFALYMFPPDAARGVTCTDGCADAWPPLTLRAGESVVAGEGVRSGLLGTTSGPEGRRVVTYHGWPLYTYLGDAEPGHAAGQGIDEDGGYWYVLHPSGQVVSQ